MQASSVTITGAHDAHHCYESQIASYNDFLDLSCDGGSNSINPVACSASMTDNEVCTLGEMKKEPDHAMFQEAMVELMKALMDNNIIEVFPRQQMMDHCQNLQAKGIDAKREQSMFTWSFKRKRHSDGSLNEYKARLCCHGGQ